MAQVQIGMVRDEKVQLRLFDASGKLISERNDLMAAGTNVIQLSVKDLAAGLYQLALSYDGGFKSLKINVIK